MLKQDKGRGVVILDKNDYISKALEFLDSEQFFKLSDDPTKSFQMRVQNKLRSMKKSFDVKTYKKI